jgi:AcrR family transcriptional regulator
MARPANPNRRATILRAATEVFTEQGFSEARLADIAQRAGVVISTLYLYFGSKEEMVYAIAREKRQILLDRLEPVLEHLYGPEAVARFVEVVFAFAQEHRDQIIVFNLESGLLPVQRIRREGRTHYGPRIERGIAIIRQLIAQGILCPYDPELIMEMLTSMTRWMVNRCLLITAEEEEPLKRFCVQWLSQALFPLPSNMKEPTANDSENVPPTEHTERS